MYLGTWSILFSKEILGHEVYSDFLNIITVSIK